MYIFSGENQDSRNGDPKARRCRRQIETPNALREGKWGPGRSPGRKRGLVHCELKRSHAVTKNVSIFITFVTHKIRNGHEKITRVEKVIRTPVTSPLEWIRPERS